MNKHTPAPWTQRTAGDPTPGQGTQIYAKNGNIATIHYGVVDIDIALANARLIAAAPELLEALHLGEYLLTIPAIQDIDNQAIRDFATKARAAIAKAQG